MREPFEPLIKLLKLRIGRIIVAVGLLSFLTGALFDSLNATNAMIISSFGCTMAFFLFGVGLLCVLPDDFPPHLHVRWYILALVFALGGGFIVLLFLYRFIRDIVAAMF